ncbi:MAG: hypothetical protein HC836_27380 [Richelia sp. RM2_1_2]|nr:hypothetical protein [Richelia sp. SM2_1_7]NJM23111.1 hypothetical protein [Richelia sp. SM1_7_0]NJN06756.1 hypothetical protein [Richelia sp. RM1_1_1]NJO28067.1 hypothetical protein [Richelia sp. SL_2_1]NJO61828.1 hypothetical protein [Richelia sp. RM2_1_2]
MRLYPYIFFGNKYFLKETRFLGICGWVKKSGFYDNFGLLQVSLNRNPTSKDLRLGEEVGFLPKQKPDF